MERNSLIYAIAEAAIIVHARFKQGGTWHGAIDAQRRRLTQLVVREDSTNAAHQALISLGAVPLQKAAQLLNVLDHLEATAATGVSPTRGIEPFGDDQPVQFAFP